MRLIALGVAGVAAIVSLSSCAPAPGGIAGTCEVRVAPDPVRRGNVSIELRLPNEFLPDNHFGKSVTYVAAPSSGGARKTGAAREDREIAHLFRFDVEIDAPGDWRIDVESTWPDGSPFASETLRIHDVP